MVTNIFFKIYAYFYAGFLKNYLAFAFGVKKHMGKSWN